jgi:hypothetical protein
MKSFKEYLNEAYTYTSTIDGPKLAPKTPGQLFNQIDVLRGVVEEMAFFFRQTPTEFVLTQVAAALVRANGLLSSVDQNDMNRDPKIKS